jgi:RNA polymerase sigma factor (sigma-70 family)
MFRGSPTATLEGEGPFVTAITLVQGTVPTGRPQFRPTDEEGLARLVLATVGAMVSIPRGIRDDLAQDAFLKVQRAVRRGTIDVEAITVPQLRLVTWNLYRDLLRRERVRRALAAKWTAENVAAASNGQAAADARLTLAALDFNALPPADRTAIAMVADGATPDEIARELRLPSGTVRRRLHDARVRLRAVLE